MKRLTRVGIVLAIGGSIFVAAPALSRAVKSVYSEERLLKFAQRLNLAPLANAPERGHFDVDLEVAPNLDGHVKVLGKACNHGTVPSSTMVAPLVERFVRRWDVGGDLATSTASAPKIKLRIDSTDSTQRCVETSELRYTCYVRTRISGTVELSGHNAELIALPVESDLEREVPFGAFCLNVTNSDVGTQLGLLHQLVNNDDKGGVAVVNREAVIGFLDKVSKLPQLQ